MNSKARLYTILLLLPQSDEQQQNAYNCTHVNKPILHLTLICPAIKTDNKSTKTEKKTDFVKISVSTKTPVKFYN